MVGDTVDLIVKDLAAIMDRLKAFSGESIKQRLSDAQLTAVLMRLRAEDVWADSNESTLQSMVAGGGYTRPQAFQILTLGSAPVRRAVEAVLSAWDEMSAVVDAGVVSSAEEPDPASERRPGRPRKPRASDDV